MPEPPDPVPPCPECGAPTDAACTAGMHRHHQEPPMTEKDQLELYGAGATAGAIALFAGAASLITGAAWADTLYAGAAAIALAILFFAGAPPTAAAARNRAASRLPRHPNRRDHR